MVPPHTSACLAERGSRRGLTTRAISSGTGRDAPSASPGKPRRPALHPPSGWVSWAVVVRKGQVPRDPSGKQAPPPPFSEATGSRKCCCCFLYRIDGFLVSADKYRVEMGALLARDVEKSWRKRSISSAGNWRGTGIGMAVIREYQDNLHVASLKYCTCTPSHRGTNPSVHVVRSAT
ncbi:hypothetical protein LZ30DRAFT_145451 [Colletotrichum cereale]|nr:hypothetical protein LZ30DRAFT_145451 [Colletotrichum cereale]